MSDGLPAGRRRRRLGQNFLSDTNLLDAIVREAELNGGDVVLEVGGGEGVLTERVAPQVGSVHVVEIDERLRAALEQLAQEHPNVRLHWGDALRLDLRTLRPPATKMVSNLPYAIAVPLIMRTIAELDEIRSWIVMVQLEIAERLRAKVGERDYGAPAAVAQSACRVEMLRRVDRAVFVPRPRVDSAVIRLVRHAPAPGEWDRRVIRAAFAHRRKRLARSLEMAMADQPGIRKRAQDALEDLGLSAGARAQELEPGQFLALAERLRQSADG